MQSARWTFLQIVRYWRLARWTKRRSYGAQKPEICKGTQLSVVQMSTVFGIRHLVNSLPSRQRTLSKYGTHPRGNAWQNSRQRAIPHSRGRPMAHVFSQRDLPSIPPYESGIHRYGSKSAILGEVILRRSMYLL